MTRPVYISEPANAELRAAIRSYEKQQAGLGGKLFDAVAETISLLQRHPEIGKAIPPTSATRHLLVEGFPYQVVYHLTETTIAVIAIAHAKRHPGYWKNRTLIDETG